MKKLLPLLILIAVAAMLVGCTMGTTSTQCTVHTDANKDLLCDTCGASVPCTEHADANEDLKCDYCQTAMECTSHKDTNKDLKCDKCKVKLPCPGHVNEDSDKNLECDLCGKILPCENHIDNNLNLKCDLCDVAVECTHKDVNNDGICDIQACLWNYDHTHTFSPAWQHSNTEHWHNATCSHDVISDKAAHADANNDGICDGCNWNYGHEHTYATEWSTDENGHWLVATCGHAVTKDLGVHVDDNGTCSACGYVLCAHTFSDSEWVGDETGHWHKPTCEHPAAKDEVLDHTFNDDGVCTVCGEETVHEHTFDTVLSHNDQKHWYAATCSHTTVTKDEKLHSECDANNDGICDECEYQFCYHTDFGTEWKTDKDNHWHEALCSHTIEGEIIKGDFAAHSDGNDDGVCDVCAYQMCEHPFNTEAWEKNITHHWYAPTCTHDAKGELGLHTDNDENNDGVCDVCEYQFCDHEYETEWSSDENNHWYASKCGHNVTDSLTAHSDENADGVCDVCGYGCEHTFSTEWSKNETHHWHDTTCNHNYTQDKAEHTDADGNLKCDTCECVYEDPNTEVVDPEGDPIILPGHIIGGKS